MQSVALRQKSWEHAAHYLPTSKSVLVAGAPSNSFVRGGARISVFAENSVFAARAEVRSEFSGHWDRTLWVARASRAGKHNILFVSRPVEILFSVANHGRLVKTAGSILRAVIRTGKPLDAIDFALLRDCIDADIPAHIAVEQIAHAA